MNEWKEEFTKCDKCEMCYECPSVMESTHRRDEFRHFVRRMGAYCPIEDDKYREKRLSELVSYGFVKLKEVLERYGDITYGELLERILRNV